MQATIRVLIFFFLMLVNINFGVAQTEKIEELKIGDRIPKQIMSIINKQQIKGKQPTIINFWATWCVPCIKELKLLDTILKEAPGINILSVTYEDNKKVESFLDRNKGLKSGRLNIISSDTLLHNYFSHRILPHNIWIDENGVIKYITGGEEINMENISSFIEKRDITTKTKEDKVSFDPFAPFHLSDSVFVYRSIVTKRIDGIFSGETVHPVGYADKQKILRAFCYNSTLNNMLWLAVNRRRSFGNYYNTMRIETADSLRFFAPSQAPITFKQSRYRSKDQWQTENTHCYELTLPFPVRDTLFYTYMLEDLKRNFNIEIELLEDSILCSVITAQKNLPPKTNMVDSSFLSLNHENLIARNVSVLYLFEYLNENVKEKLNDKPIDPPFKDKTEGMRVDIHLEFKTGMPKYRQIIKMIEEKYGLKIRYQKERYPITVVKDMG